MPYRGSSSSWNDDDILKPRNNAEVKKETKKTILFDSCKQNFRVCRSKHVDEMIRLYHQTPQSHVKCNEITTFYKTNPFILFDTGANGYVFILCRNFRFRRPYLWRVKSVHSLLVHGPRFFHFHNTIPFKRKIKLIYHRTDVYFFGVKNIIISS